MYNNFLIISIWVIIYWLIVIAIRLRKILDKL